MTEVQAKLSVAAAKELLKGATPTAYVRSCARCSRRCWRPR
jgi:hypothetical protein